MTEIKVSLRASAIVPDIQRDLHQKTSNTQYCEKDQTEFKAEFYSNSLPTGISYAKVKFYNLEQLGCILKVL